MIDILTALLLGIFMWIGYKKGLLKSVFGIVSLLFGIYLAFVLYPYLRNIVSSSILRDTVFSIVKEKYVMPRINNGSMNISLFPQYLKSMISTGQITLTNGISEFVTNLVISIFSYLFVFLTVFIIIRITGRIIRFTSKLPVIRFFDKAGGAIFGLFEGIIVLYIVLAITYTFAPLGGVDIKETYLKDTTLTQIMYDNNPIIKMVMPSNFDELIKKTKGA